MLASATGYDTEPVYLSVTGATMTVTSPEALSQVLISGESGTFYGWPLGRYSITYVFDSGYSDPGNLPSGFIIGDCSEKQDAEAKAIVEACTEGATSIPVQP